MIFRLKLSSKGHNLSYNLILSGPFIFIFIFFLLHELNLILIVKLAKILFY